MAKIFRFSGYLVESVCAEDKAEFTRRLKEILRLCKKDILHQFHVEESEKFDLDGEDAYNCDLALLTRHFKANNSPILGRKLPEAGECYRHFKIGKIVRIIGISRHTETEEISVVYDYEGKIWNRPLDMFMSEVDHKKYPEATQKYRFEKAEE